MMLERFEEVRDLVWRLVNERVDRLKREKEAKGDGWSVPHLLSSLHQHLISVRNDNFRSAFTQRIVLCCEFSQQEYVLLVDSLQKHWEQVKSLVLISFAAARARIEKESEDDE